MYPGNPAVASFQPVPAIRSREYGLSLCCSRISIVFLPFVLYVKTLYSQVFFIMLDFPELSAKECLKRSRRLMKGHKWQYFLLMVSFLPWLMGGFLTCGIGLLYVYPYQKQTYAYFYLELVSLKSAEA